MHIGNHYYGHDFILAWAASIREPRAVFGYVQHGWKPEQAIHLTRRPVPGAPVFVWSRANIEPTRRAMPHRPVIAIGAPFLYLCDMLEIRGRSSPELDLLLYPCHGLGSDRLPHEVHHSLVEQVMSLRDRPTSVTVCLHPHEQGLDEVRDIYRRLPGSIFISNWLSEPYRLAWDPTIYVRQMTHILRHERVMSNCLTTALFYAAYLEREIRLLSHPSRRPRPTEGRGAKLHAELEAAGGGSSLAAIARHELGEDCMLKPDVLRGTLGWHSRWRTPLARVIQMKRRP